MRTNLRPFPDLPSAVPRHLQFILDLSPSTMTLGLGNIRALLERIGHPERAFRSVVVAGTNGKGSVTSMLASILSGTGYRVGRFTSPHVYSVTERIAVDGEPVGMEAMERAAERIVPIREEIPFSYFEALTAIAFLEFAERGVEVAVLETGLGGRFDATNAVDPILSIVTGISLDHRRVLGDTVEEILREKLGITRPGVPLLVGELPDNLLAIAREKSERDGFPLLTADALGTARVCGAGLGSLRVTLSTELADYGVLDLPFPGRHQVSNALLAIGAAERVSGAPLRNLPAALAEAYLPGRFEVIENGCKTFILDVAHNDQALNAGIEQLLSASPREDNVVVLGLLRRKELFEYPQRLFAGARRVYLVSTFEPDAYTPAELLRRYLVRGLSAAGADVILWNRRDPSDDHWLRLVRRLESRDLSIRNVLVTGSHHVVDQFGRRLLA
jgi:dihydrofolate synthase/folylpolyglutamate synthase